MTIISLLIPLFIIFQSSYSDVNHSIYKTKEDCLECHTMALPTHILSEPLNMSEELPLDFAGKMSCLTCHNCTTGKCVLRKNKRELCIVCHDCTQGMSCMIGIAHLGSSKNIESWMNICISCHDGITGPFMNPESKMINKYYMVKKGFRDISHSNIILVSGKVTCISCHNPYSSEKERLIKSSEGSLCLTCHRK